MVNHLKSGRVRFLDPHCTRIKSLWLISGDSLGLTAKGESELGLMALGCIALYLQEALIDQATIQ